MIGPEPIGGAGGLSGAGGLGRFVACMVVVRLVVVRLVVFLVVVLLVVILVVLLGVLLVVMRVVLLVMRLVVLRVVVRRVVRLRKANLVVKYMNKNQKEFEYLSFHCSIYKYFLFLDQILRVFTRKSYQEKHILTEKIELCCPL